MFKKECCYNGGNKHNFKPRYDEVPYPGNIKIGMIYEGGYRNLLYHKVYVKDVCEWCGKEIKRYLK